MSNALLEAMSCGLAIVATRVGAAESMIESGRSGLLIPPSDVAELQTALQQVLTDTELRTRLGAAAARDVEQYSIDRVVDQISGEYTALLETADKDSSP